MDLIVPNGKCNCMYCVMYFVHSFIFSYLFVVIINNAFAVILKVSLSPSDGH